MNCILLEYSYHAFSASNQSEKYRFVPLRFGRVDIKLMSMTFSNDSVEVKIYGENVSAVVNRTRENVKMRPQSSMRLNTQFIEDF